MRGSVAQFTSPHAPPSRGQALSFSALQGANAEKERPVYFVVADIPVHLAVTVDINIFIHSLIYNLISIYGAAVTPTPFFQ